MAFEYPDIMNDVLDARRRYESGVVQYLAALPEGSVPAGDVARIPLVLQNVMEVPIKVAVHIVLPDLDRKLKRLPQPLFQVFRPDVQFELAQGEVAELVIPVGVQPHVPPGEYEFVFQVQSEAAQEGLRARPEHGENRVGDLKIRYPQGMHITQIAPWGFEVQKTPKQTLALTVGPAGKPPEGADLKPAFTLIWTPADWDLISEARQEVNERRIHIAPEVTAEALYLPFMQESQTYFGDSGVQLHIGEAIFLAKILTYTVTYLMANADWQDCLLVPIYAFALAQDNSTDDVFWLLTQLGYTHVVELAIAISFALVEDALGRELWSGAEQRPVREYITECLGNGATLPAEFLYLPLILGGIVISDQLMLEDEDLEESLRLLGKSKAEREDLFADPDLAMLNDAFDRLLAKQARRRGRS